MSNRLLSLFLKGLLLVFFGLCLAVVLFFANGYSFDFVSQVIRKTGSIQIEYRDNQARVSLDGQKLDGRLPFVISGVLPGKHWLEIEKSGYGKWKKVVEVKEDLISRVEGVFLVPIDQNESIKLLIEANADSYKVFYAGDYLVLIGSEEIKYATLSRDVGWGNLKSGKLNFGVDEVTDVKAYDRFLRFELVDKSVHLFDLKADDWFDQKVNDGFIYAGNNWYYLKDRLFAIYDEKLTRLIQANRFEQYYEDLSYENIDGRDWYLLKKASKLGDLYFKRAGEMILVEENVKDFQKGKLETVVYVKNDNTLWQYQLLDGQKKMLARFSDDFELIGNNLQINQNYFGWIYKQGNKFWIADQNWSNSVSLVDNLKIIEVRYKNPGQIYVLSSVLDSDKEIFRLYLLDLENQS